MSEEDTMIPTPLPHIGGTLIWYYMICHRELWLMAHALNPDEDDPNIEYGRFLHERAYAREGNEVELENSKMDRVIERDGHIIVVEIKKSSSAIDSARTQLVHYLMELEERGISAQGELRFPEERRKEIVILDDAWRERLRNIKEEIVQITAEPKPPPAKRVSWCSRCGYVEFCWS
ncbi:CRISPR-associated protein Cas4 [Sulfobacillus thermosulfidooxidans]|uniref:CRISPR-associated protein Cas4 n=1 Tax=Sulfobacillus thermosulfidooxidans TaxID=28034 RepID=UPI000A8FBBB3|nr:CRISPR-associated protein Cas4 [Sulfobacillus thermosulfidooxidans]